MKQAHALRDEEDRERDRVKKLAVEQGARDEIAREAAAARERMEAEARARELAAAEARFARERAQVELEAKVAEDRRVASRALEALANVAGADAVGALGALGAKGRPGSAGSDASGADLTDMVGKLAAFRQQLGRLENAKARPKTPEPVPVRLGLDFCHPAVSVFISPVVITRSGSEQRPSSPF